MEFNKPPINFNKIDSDKNLPHFKISSENIRQNAQLERATMLTRWLPEENITKINGITALEVIAGLIERNQESHLIIQTRINYDNKIITKQQLIEHLKVEFKKQEYNLQFAENNAWCNIYDHNQQKYYLNLQEDQQIILTRLPEISTRLSTIYDDLQYDNIIDDSTDFIERFIKIMNIPRHHPDILSVMRGQPEKTEKLDNLKKWLNHNNIEVKLLEHLASYESIIGLTKQIEDLKTIAVMNRARRFEKNCPRMTILEGDHGSGKKILAESFAKDLQANLWQLNSEHFKINDTPGKAKLDEIFEMANQEGPTVLLIHHVDKLVRTSTSNGDYGYALNQLATRFREQMDKLNTKPNIFVVMTTEDISNVDPYILPNSGKTNYVSLAKLEKSEYSQMRTAMVAKILLDFLLESEKQADFPKISNRFSDDIDVPDIGRITDGLTLGQIETILSNFFLQAKSKNEIINHHKISRYLDSYTDWS